MSMIRSSAGWSKSFWRSSRGLAIAPPNTDDHQGITNRGKPKSQNARKCPLNPRFLADPVTSSPPNYLAFSGAQPFFTGDSDRNVDFPQPARRYVRRLRTAARPFVQ